MDPRESHFSLPLANTLSSVLGPNLLQPTLIQKIDSIVARTDKAITTTVLVARLAPKSFKLKAGYSGS